jgi:hypothetical protein
MGGIISRKKKAPDPDPALAVDTDQEACNNDQSSVQSNNINSPNKSNSRKNKKLEADEVSPSKKVSAKLKKGETLSTKSTTNKTSAKGREANKQFQRKVYLKERGAKLRGRLKDRPTDQRALQEYGAVLYEQENYITAPKVIKRILATGDTSGDWYLKLGKCYFRRWARVGNIKGE